MKCDHNCPNIRQGLPCTFDVTSSKIAAGASVKSVSSMGSTDEGLLGSMGGMITSSPLAFFSTSSSM